MKTENSSYRRRRAGALIGLAVLLFLARQTAAAAQHEPSSQGAQNHSMQDMPGMDMSKDHSMNKGNMNHGTETNSRTESDAVHSMQAGHHMDGPHMRMTPPRKATLEDQARADEIAATLRVSIEKYRDYRVALADGYRIFLPKLPQPMYHFTNYWNGFLEGFTFDPARPTSLLYKKTKGGYELIGAMYTTAKGASLDQLNERVPLGIVRWHAHTNLCLPRSGEATRTDWTRFGLNGSISTAAACKEAGGRFYPQIFGWMVHVYPFESSREKIWAQ